MHCKVILPEFQIVDLEIAFRESVYTRFAGPQLLNHVSSVDPTADVRAPLTPALGLRIAPKAHPYFEGTGGLYSREGGQHNRVLLLTARHVVLPASQYRCNELYFRKDNSSPRIDVILLGNKAYQNVLKSIMAKIWNEALMTDHYTTKLQSLGEAVEGEGTEIADARQTLKGKLVEVEKSTVALNEFHSKTTRFWTIEDHRILGKVLHAPPISVATGDKLFTEDWAFVELDGDKIDWDGFKGNVIHIGTFRSISPRSSSLTIMYIRELNLRPPNS